MKLTREFIAQARRSAMEMIRDHRRRSRPVRRKLYRLLESVRSQMQSSAGIGVGRRRIITLRLDPWQIEAARLVSEIRATPYQERLRAWVAAGIFAEAELLRRQTI